MKPGVKIKLRLYVMKVEILVVVMIIVILMVSGMPKGTFAVGWSFSEAVRTLPALWCSP